jgi:hypothetical protein
MEIKYKFSNGVTITGTAQQVLDYAKMVGEVVDPKNLGDVIPRGYYDSKTKGLLKISEMVDHHIVNALNKLTIDYYTALKPGKDLDLKKYLVSFVGLTNDPEVEDLYTELVKRAK